MNEDRTDLEDRIAVLLPSFVAGGAERAMIRLAKGFVERGVKVDLVVTKVGGPLADQIDERVNVVDLGARRAYRALPGLVRYLRRAQPKALVSALETCNVIAVLARSLAGVSTRIVISERCTKLQLGTALQDAVMRRMMRLVYPRADHIVAVSEGVADDMVGRLGLRRDQIEVIYNPVVSGDLLAQAVAPVDHPWFAAGGPPVILTAGRLEWQKDQGTLLRAFAAIRSRRPARLVIIGEGRERDQLAQLAVGLGIEQDVSLPGFAHNPAAFMSKAAVFVLSSRREGLPNALIEAMALGTPVISTDCPSGPDEILEGGRWGRLVPVGDPVAMAQAIDSSLDQPGPDPRNRAASFSVSKAVEGYARALRLRLQ